MFSGPVCWWTRVSLPAVKIAQEEDPVTDSMGKKTRTFCALFMRFAKQFLQESLVKKRSGDFGFQNVYVLIK